MQSKFAADKYTRNNYGFREPTPDSFHAELHRTHDVLVDAHDS